MLKWLNALQGDGIPLSPQFSHPTSSPNYLGTSLQMTSDSGRPAKRRRVTQACDYCHRRSIRCQLAEGDIHQRCTNCVDFDQPCTRDRAVRRRGVKPNRGTSQHTLSPSIHSTRTPESNGVIISRFSDSITWTPPPVASQAVVVDLIDVYFEVVYPIFPLFHRPTFLRKISRGEYGGSREMFAVTMAACALASARAADNALFDSWEGQTFGTTPSSVFYEAAIEALPKTDTPNQSLDLMRAYALLSLTAIQHGNTRDMQAYLGRYHALVAMDGLHDEANWPQNLGIVELEERRRLVSVPILPKAACH